MFLPATTVLFFRPLKALSTLSQKSEVVTGNGETTATVALFCDSGEGLTCRQSVYATYIAYMSDVVTPRQPLTEIDIFFDLSMW